MTPEQLRDAVFALQRLLIAAPGMVSGIQAILAKENPTNEDWEALAKMATSKKYSDYVPDSQLPKDE